MTSGKPKIEITDIIEHNGIPVAVLQIRSPETMTIFSMAMDAGDIMRLYQEMDEAFFAFENRPKGPDDER